MSGPLDLPPALSESESLAVLRDLAAQNNPLTPMIGLGYHGTVTPSVIRRNVLEDPSWYTAYTPYQPEISQGRLEALLNFQTLVCDLTGLATSGASLLDESTAVAEAMTLARRTVRSGQVVLLDADTLPQTIGVVRTRAGALGLEVVVADRPADRGAGRGRPVRRGRPDPGGQRAAGRHRRADRARRRGARARRPGHRRLRPAGPDADDPAGGVGRRHRRRLQPAPRRTPVLRRPARRLHRRPRRPGALAARPAGRGLPGRRRDAGLPAGAADPRAAHPAGEGDLQHLHRAGAAGRRRQHVRGLPRPRGPAGDRRHRPPAGGRAGRRPRRRRVHASSTRRSSTPCWSPRPAARPRSWPAARERGVHLRLVGADAVGISVGEDATEADLEAVRAAFGAESRGSVAGVRGSGRQRAHLGLPDASGLQHPPQRDRDAALPAGAVGARLRAGPRDDPAGLLHDEAERDLGDGADLLRRLRQPAPVRPGRGRAGVRDADRHPGGLAGRGHRLCPRLDPAQRRQPG